MNPLQVALLLLAWAGVCYPEDRIVANFTMSDPGNCNTSLCPSAEDCNRAFFRNDLCVLLSCQNKSSCDHFIVQLGTNKRTQEPHLPPSSSPASHTSAPTPAPFSAPLSNSSNSNSSNTIRPTQGEGQQPQTTSSQGGDQGQNKTTSPQGGTPGQPQNQTTSPQEGGKGPNVTQNVSSPNGRNESLGNSSEIGHEERPHANISTLGPNFSKTTVAPAGGGNTTTATPVGITTTATPTTTVKVTPSPSTTPKPPTTPSKAPFLTSTPPSTTSHGPKGSQTTPKRGGVPSEADKALVEAAGGELMSQVMNTSSLLAVLIFGLLFFVVTVALFLRHAYESYKRRDYTQVDYLINGMYSDSGL